MSDWYFCVSRGQHVSIYRERHLMIQLSIQAIRILDTRFRDTPPGQRYWYILDQDHNVHQIILDVESGEVIDKILRTPSDVQIRDLSVMSGYRSRHQHLILLDSRARLHQLETSGEITQILQLDYDDNHSHELRFLPYDGRDLALVDSHHLHLVRYISLHRAHCFRVSMSGVESVIGQGLNSAMSLILERNQELVRVNSANGELVPCHIYEIRAEGVRSNLIDQCECSIDSCGNLYIKKVLINRLITILDDSVLTDLVEIHHLLLPSHQHHGVLAILGDSEHRLYALHQSRDMSLTLDLILENVDLKTRLVNVS